MTHRKLAVLLLAGAAITTPFIQASAQPAVQAAAQMPRWAHQQSDLQPDPAARFGQLSNGMRYVIYRNATPPGQVSIRFRFDAGDLMERDEQSGLAHFLEHMVINETKSFPEGELLRTLERQGLAFGREVNASTWPDQTVYFLDIPGVTEQKLDIGLHVMREMASEATFNPAAIDRERGIIISEDRSMFPPARRAGNEQTAFMIPGQLLARRLDIGDLNVIRNAPRELFVDLYQKYYRPERATLIIVGDVDPAAVENKIRARFTDWRGVGPAGAEPDVGQVRQRGFEAGSTVMEGALPSVSLSWVRPFDASPHNLAEESKDWREQLALAVLDRRLTRISETPDAPFTSPGAGVSGLLRSAEYTSVSVDPKPGKYAESAAVLEREVRRLLEHGILDSELNREISEMRSRLQAMAAGASTRQTANIADQIFWTVHNNDVLMSPQQNLAAFEAAVRGYDGATAGQVARTLFTGSGPLLYATSPTPIEGGHQALATAFNASRATPVEAPVALAVKEWPYQSFGQPGRVVEREEIADLGTTRVRFANGVTLLVKPTTFAQDRVSVNVRIGGGTLALPPELVALPIWQGAFIEGGLGRMTHREMTETLSGKIYSAQFLGGEDSFNLRGTTRPADLGTQLQVLAAYASDPGWGADAFERKRAETMNILNVIRTTPMNTAMTQFPRLVRSGDRRFGFPSDQELTNAQLAPVRAAFDPLLKTAPLEVAIVGNVTVDEAIAQTAATFGALPQRRTEMPRLPGADRITFAGGGSQELQHRGRPDVSLGLIAWQTDDFYDSVADARAQQLLRSLIQLRATDKLREELGATYSPLVMQDSSEYFDEFGLIAMGAEVNPSQLDRLLQVINEVAEELKTTEVGADELGRAREPMLQQLSRDRAGNEFWLARLSGGTWYPRRLEGIRTQEQLLRAITPADIRRMAQTYFRPDRMFRLKVVPATAAAATPAAAPAN